LGGGLVERRGELLTVLSSVLWGSSFVAIKLGLAYSGIYWFLLERFIAASFVGVVILSFWRGIDRSYYRKGYVWLLGFLNAAGFILQYLALSLTTPGRTALLVNLNVVVIAILSGFYLHEKIGGNKILALLVGALGLFLVTTHGDLGQLGGSQSRGDLLAFLSGLVWTFYIVKVRQLVTRNDTSTSQLTVALLVSTTFALILPTLLLTTDYSTPPVGILFAVYTGVACTTIPLVLWAEGLRHITATVSSIVLLLEILFAFVFAVPLGLENFGALDAAGGGLILFAIFLATRGKPIRSYLKNSTSLPTPRETARS
jgi:drug/metabolite transporter (DMT)-like permease